MRWPWRKPFDYVGHYGMSEEDFKTLSRYNGEVYRGVQHTDEWKAQMSILQQRFDTWMKP